MTQSGPSSDQLKALQAYLMHAEKSLFASKFRLDGLSELIEKDDLPLAFLAFEVLEAIVVAKQEGFSPEQYHKVVPDRFSSETVEVPVFLLNVLLNCWSDFSRSDPKEGSLDRSFGNAAKGRRKWPFLHKWQKLDKERFYAFAVLEVRLKRYFAGNPVSFTEAFEEVSGDEEVSSAVVKKAWEKHRAFFEDLMLPFNIKLSELGKN